MKGGRRDETFNFNDHSAYFSNTYCESTGNGRREEDDPALYAPSGGTAYILGAGLASVTNKYMPDVEMVVEATTGTLEMVRRLMERERMTREAFATFGTVEGNDAFKGLREHSGKACPTLRAVSFQTSYVIYLTVPANSPIKSYADIKGKRVGMSGAGSSVAVLGFFLLEAHGVKKEDFKPYFYTYKETMEGIKDGGIDAGFLGGAIQWLHILNSH